MSENGARRPGLRALADLATPMAVRVAATLRLADRVEQGLCTAPLLAEATGTHPDALERLLRHLVTVGLFTEKPRGNFALTEYGRQLCEGHEGGRRQWLDTTTAVGRGDLSLVDLEHSVRTGEAAYHVRHGVPFWDDLSADPRLSASFDALMGHHVGYDGGAVVDAYDWGALGHVVDVGGGSGALLCALLKAHPRLEGTLVDLQGPASAARRSFRNEGLSDRARAVVGSFFDPLPAGAGGYVLSSILHDWADDPAAQILGRCAEAAGSGGTVLVVEAVGADGESPSTAMDLRMLVYSGGRERGLSDLGGLAERAGLSLRAVHPAGYISVVELAVEGD